MSCSRKRDRITRLLQQAKILGDERFDPEAGLIAAVNGPKHTGHVVAQQSLEYAIALLETGGDTLRANAIIRKVLEFQVTDPRHHRYGNFRWMAHWDEPLDPNAVAFVTPNLVYLYQRHAGVLEPETLAAMEASFPLCGEALLRREVPYEYTNIKLLTILAQFLLGELLPGSALEHTARFHWKHFVAFTALYGWAEYNSPTYSPVCIYALERLVECGPSDLRPAFERLLEYCYFEFAARYHAPSGFLAGAMSRAYPPDVINGQGLGGLVAHLQWEEPFHRLDNLNMVGYLLNAYMAPAEIQQIALKKAYPLEIKAQINHPRFITRTDYLAEEFTLGSQNGYFGNQEVPLFASIQNEAGPYSLYLEASPASLSRLVSSQRGAEVTGTYYFDQSAVRAHLATGPETQLIPLSLRLKLGQQSAVSEVSIDGEPWDYSCRPIGDKTTITLKVGSIHIGFTLQVIDDRAGQGSPVLEVQSGEIVLRYLVSQSVSSYAAHRLTGGISFYLALAPAMDLASVSALHERLKTAVLDIGSLSMPACGVSVAGAGGPMTVPLPTPQVLHSSPLTRIEPNSLLPWLEMRTSDDSSPLWHALPKFDA